MTDTNSNVEQNFAMSPEGKALLYQVALEQSYNPVVLPMPIAMTRTSYMRIPHLRK